MKKKLLSALLALALVFSSVPAPVFAVDGETAGGQSAGVATPAAEQGLLYLNEKGEQETYAGEYHTLTAEDSELTGGWYLVSGEVILPQQLTVSGEVTIVLADGARLEAQQGIELTNSASFTITAQSKGEEMGSLTATGSTDHAGIGSGYGSGTSSIIINGGAIVAQGNGQAAGIGSSGYSSGGSITINGGSVTATGGADAWGGGAGIGSVSGGGGWAITVSGGTVRATGNVDGSDIGGSRYMGGNSFATGEGGNAVIYAGSIVGSDAPTDWNCIWFTSDSAGAVYGSVTLEENLTVGAGVTLTVGAGATLTVPKGVTLANNGNITGEGSILVEAGGGFLDGGSIDNPVTYQQVRYLDQDGEEQTISADQLTLVDSSTTELTDGWYLVSGEVALPQRPTVTGEATVILADGAHLDAQQGIGVNEGNSLTITAQSKDAGTMGVLTATGSRSDAGIGGDGGSSGIGGGSITINGGAIEAIGGASNSGFGGAGIGGGNNGAGGSITINGGVVEATGGKEGAGIGGGNNGPSGGNITINGGTVTATGGEEGAGIGGGYYGAGGNITINGGTITAAGTAGGAGIGGGYHGASGSITITGGVIDADGSDTSSSYESGGGAGIGGGAVGSVGSGNITIAGGIITAASNSGGDDIGTGMGRGNYSDTDTQLNGNAVLFAGTITGSWSPSSWNCIWFKGDAGNVYGNVTLGGDLTVEEGQTLTVPAGATLNDGGNTITNNGAIQVMTGGSYAGNEIGPNKITYEGISYLDADGNTQITTEEVKLLTDSNQNWDLTSGWYLVRGSFTVADRINISGDVTIILENGAELTATQGIGVNEGNSLTITAQSKDAGTMGVLTATGGNYYAGIGSGDGTNIGMAAGEITINGGKITATGTGEYAAGIGSSKDSCGTITINGGIVEATGDTNAPGIGGYRLGGSVILNGGQITANGGSYCPGIGGTRVEVTINGGEITAKAKSISAGIEADSGKVTINGGTVTATGNIGPGIGGNKTEITITGGTVHAVAGGSAAADIGESTSSNPKFIIISGGTVYAEKISGSFSTGTPGSAVIYADEITGSENTDGWNCIWFDSDTAGTVYGDVTLGGELTIEEGQTLTVQEGATLNDGGKTITNNGEIKLDLGGSYAGDQPAGNKLLCQIGWDTNGDGTIEENTYVAIGQKPVYEGTSAKEQDEAYTYTFSSWSPAIAAASGPATYTAQFDKTPRQYTVTLPAAEDRIGYTLSYTDPTTLNYGSAFSFTLTLADGYSMTGTVKANGQTLVAENGVYTVTVTGDTAITVEGVADITAPEAILTIGENQFKSFLNTITFGLFFNENVEVTLTAEDGGSGLAGLYYLRSETPLTEQALADAAWVAYSGPIAETAEDAEQFIYYGKAVDKAGNVTLLSSDGVVFDTAAPTVTGAIPGGIYYTTQQITVVDQNLDTLTLNGAAVTSPVTLTGDTDADYTLVATDKAGNTVTLTVTMKPISSLLPPDPATSADKAKIEELQKTVEGLLAGEMTDAEREKLEAAGNQIDAALDQLDQAAAAGSTEAIDKVESLDPGKVQPTDKEDLEAAKEDLENALENFGDNYTEEEKQQLEDALDRVNDALDRLDQAAAAGSTEAIDKVESLDPDKVQPTDKKDLEAAKEDLENALENFGDNYTEEEKQQLEDALDRVNEALDRLDQAAAAGSTEAIDKVENLDPGKVQPTDKEDLEAAKEDLENALENFGDNYTEEEKQQLEDALDRVNEALETIEKAETVQGAVDALPDTVAPDDLEMIEKIEAAKEQYDQLTDHQKELAGNAGEKLDALLAAAANYRILDGDGSVWTQGGGESLVIRANGAPEKLVDLLLDGSSVPAEGYTIRKGSTIATLTPAYLATLTAGEHTLTFVYENGQVSANFTIAASGTAGDITTGGGAPNTGDPARPALWAALALLCAAALAAVLVLKRKKTQH